MSDKKMMSEIKNSTKADGEFFIIIFDKAGDSFIDFSILHKGFATAKTSQYVKEVGSRREDDVMDVERNYNSNNVTLNYVRKNFVRGMSLLYIRQGIRNSMNMSFDSTDE